MAVYFIRDAERPEVKIGYSYCPATRMKALQCGHKRPLQLLKTLPGARAEEAAFHRRFKEYKIWGEWFRLEGKLARFIGRKRPRKILSFKEALEATLRDLVASGWTEQQIANALKVSTGTVYNLLRELNER